MASNTATVFLLVVCFTAAAVARKPLANTAPTTKYSNFYDALVADSSHKLIVQAIANDATTKAMLKLPLNVTAFVPTDAAFLAAALKYKLGTDPTKLMDNTCLINAILKYHIISPGMTQAKLATTASKNTMLVVSSTVNGVKKTTAKVLKFKAEGNNVRVVGGATSGLLGNPRNVAAGKGIIHNINNVLLPTTNVTTLAKMTGCTISL